MSAMAEAKNAEILTTGKIYIDKNVVFFNNGFISAQNICRVAMYKKDKDYSEQIEARKEYDSELKDYNKRKQECENELKRIQSNNDKVQHNGIRGCVAGGIVTLVGIIFHISFVWKIGIVGLLVVLAYWGMFTKESNIKFNEVEPKLILPDLPLDEYGIKIVLNSGDNFRWESKNEEFIHCIAKTLLECINHKTDGKVFEINFSHCTVDNKCSETNFENVVLNDSIMLNDSTMNVGSAGN